MINCDWHYKTNTERIFHWIIYTEIALVFYISFSHILLLKQRLQRILCLGNISQELEGFGPSLKEPREG